MGLETYEYAGAKNPRSCHCTEIRYLWPCHAGKRIARDSEGIVIARNLSEPDISHMKAS